MYVTMGTDRVALRETISAQIVRVLSTFPEVELGYLFGSFLEREDFRDIDVALWFAESPGSPAALRRLALRIGRELEKVMTPRREVDVRVLNVAPIAFQHGVVKQGKPVFVRDEVGRVRYEVAVLGAYLDYRETLEWFNRRFLAGIR